MMRRLILMCAVLCAATSCTQVTQTTVVIEADEVVTAAHPQVQVQIFRADEVSGALDIEERNQLVPTELDYPIRIAIVPRDGASGRRYDVRVTAVAGARTWTTRAISGFVPGQHRELHMLLEDMCRTRVCPSQQTCRGGDCVPIDVDPNTLLPPGTESDASFSADASVLPHQDTAPADASRGCASGLFGTSLFSSACFR